MRLWHKDLIPVLPRQQLLAQWRECCCIARNISVNGTPNHLLVNRIMNYPPEDLFTYGMSVTAEMKKRGYNATLNSMKKFTADLLKHDENACQYIPMEEVFFDWHNDRYLYQCFYNLQEKYDCGGITEDEWGKIAAYMENKFLDDYIKRMRGI